MKKDSNLETRKCPKCEAEIDVKRQMCDCGYNIGYFYKFGRDYKPSKATLWFTK